jgi:TolB-like protein/DNA-binding winged helix-turn-helix (wHTH) protein/Flp pilus assembly protein TadD
MSSGEQLGSLIRFGVFEIDLKSGELRKHGLRVKLRDQSFQVLTLLLERPGQVVTREELQRKLWAADTFVDFDRGLNKAINRLRDALGDSAEAPQFVETLPKRGYRFIAPVEDSRAAGLVPPPESPLEVKSEPEPPPAIPVPVNSHTRLWWLALATPLVAVIAVQTSSGRHGRTTLPSPPVTPGRIMLAVLPFDNLTGDPDQEYLSDGMTEEIITRLGQLQPEQLGVIARTSVMGYKHRNHLDQIARELGVQYVVEGSVRRSSNQVRMSAQVIRVKDQTQLWAGMYDRSAEDILRLQSDFAEAVADAIQLKLTSQKRTLLASAQTVNAEAYDAYLRGRYMLNRRTSESLQNAVISLQQSIKADPTFALAYAALGDCYGVMAAYGISEEDSIRKAESMSRKALAIDNSIAEAHASLALMAQFHDRNFAEAESEYLLAFSFDPNFAIAHMWRSVMLEAKGRFEEDMRELEIAHRLDPLSPMFPGAEGESLYMARQYDQAIETLTRAQEMEPNRDTTYFWRGLAYEQKARFQEAINDLQRAVEIDDKPLNLAALGHVYALSGRKQEAWKILLSLDNRAEHEYVDPWSYGVIYAGFGDRDAAFHWLEKAYQQRSYWIFSLKVAAIFDSLHSDPRFNEMVHRLNLDE